ncbi:hypothetical protein D3C81_1941510 [compost metagenome]
MLIEVKDLPPESEYRTVLHLVDQRMLVYPQPDHFPRRSAQLFVPVLSLVIRINHVHIIAVIIDFPLIGNDMNPDQIIA